MKMGLVDGEEAREKSITGTEEKSASGVQMAVGIVNCDWEELNNSWST